MNKSIVMNRLSMLVVIFSLFVSSCKDKEKDKINKQIVWSLMKSKNNDSIIDAIDIIQKYKDTSMLSALLYDAYNEHITHRLKYKGMSVYQIKMETIQYITQQKPPVKITCIPDSSIINFYRRMNQ